MAKLNWIDITREDVISAIKKFHQYNPEYPEPRSTFLVYEGRKLPAKHIRGMAYQEHYGVPISKSDFGGGLETVKFFERLGFEVDYHASANGITKVKEVEKSVKKGAKPASAPPIEKVVEPLPQPEGEKDKIVIPTKGVIEQKNALQLILNRMFSGDIVCEKTYPWMKTPDSLDGPYKRLYDSLVAYRGDTTFAKKGVTLRCDFVCESRKLIIEYDERQHFSAARRVALEAYSEVPVSYDRQLWINACHSINAKDNSPFNRDEIRAYYDSVRDISCSEHGYKLVRIMHGQVDFEAENAEEALRKLLDISAPKSSEASCQAASPQDFSSEEILKKAPSIKIAMYLQTDELKNNKEFRKILPLLKSANADILVFPEYCYTPFTYKITYMDITNSEDQNKIYDLCLEFSKELGKAVIVSSHDNFGTIYSVYANANANVQEGETDLRLYIKHTMCESSCLEFEGYPELAKYLFDPIIYKGYFIGMTICYDCNHALFSRLYGMYGIDVIINSTGGNVIYDKWFKYNKARAIENDCFTLVTMGGYTAEPTNNNYVFGFNRNGGQIHPVNLCGDSSKHNISGGLYIYEIGEGIAPGEIDTSNQTETENKSWDLEFPVGKSSDLLKGANKIQESIFHKSFGKSNVFFLLVDGEDILLPEKVQTLLYSDELKRYTNRKYIIINRHDKIDTTFFQEKLSIILKVRAMENFCAVILESENINKCYQCGKNRTAQVVKATSECWRIDLERTSGPEAIWKNKMGMKASWRKNYEWLVKNASSLYDEWMNHSES